MKPRWALGLAVLPLLACDPSGAGATSTGPEPAAGELCYVLTVSEREDVCAPWICVSDEQIADDLVLVDLNVPGGWGVDEPYDVLMAADGSLIGAGFDMNIGDEINASDAGAVLTMAMEGWPTDLEVFPAFAENQGRTGISPTLTKTEDGFTFDTGVFGYTELSYRPATCPSDCQVVDEIGDPACACGCEYETDVAPTYALSGLVAIDWANTP